jgi:hypothetical protein
MTENEAHDLADKIESTGVATAKVVRILPEEIDPPRPGDNGWDVETTVK